jgi:hypothetical protein
MRTFARGFLVVAALTSVVGCGSEGDGAGSDEGYATESAVREGSVEARAMLAFLNDPAIAAADVKAAGATSSASKAAVAHRNGLDGKVATDDDDPFDTVAEVDAVAGIGPATLRKLAGYALLKGFGAARGLHHDVYFTHNQAKRTLALVNEATLEELDVDASLDRRAAQTIVDARPIGSLEQLGSLSRVKSTALRLLRDHADLTRGAARCDAATKCAPGLFCTGFPSNAGVCVDNAVEGAYVPCSSQGACGAGLVCAGRTASFSGMCNPAWMQDEFVSEVSGSIPDGPDGLVGAGVLVSNLATKITDATLRVWIDHDRPGDLELTLTSPDDTVLLVWPAGGGALPESINVEVPDDSANGMWTLTMYDKKAGVQGSFGRVALEVTTRFD